MNELKKFFSEQWVKSVLVRLFAFLVLTAVISCMFNAFAPIIVNEASMTQMEASNYGYTAATVANNIMHTLSGLSTFLLFAALFGKDIYRICTLIVKAVMEVKE